MSYEKHGIVLQPCYHQKDYIPDESTLPKVDRRQDIATLNKELTKRTLAEKSEMWCAYSRANVDIARKASIKSFGSPGKFKNHLLPFTRVANLYQFRPCLIVGYGPSFHDNLEQMKMIPRHKCRIIAAERCLPEMYYAGILPDAVVNLDSGDQTKFFYFGTISVYLDHLCTVGFAKSTGPGTYAPTEKGRTVPISDPRTKNDMSHAIYNRFGWIDARHRILMQLLLDGVYSVEAMAKVLKIHPYKSVPTNKMHGMFSLTTNPDVRKWFRGKVFWFNPSVYPWKNTFSYDLQEETGIGVIPTAGNVGTTMVCLALSLGCQPIFLLGMDFAHRLSEFDPSRMSVTEFLTYCPKCKTGHRRIMDLPHSCVCQNKDCGATFDPYDPAVKSYCTNTSYKAYAHSTKNLLTSESYHKLFETARVFNLSGGILHGPFIKDTTFPRFLKALDKWDMVNDLERIKKSLAAKGRSNQIFNFKMWRNTFHDDAGTFEILEGARLEEAVREGKTIIEVLDGRKATLIREEEMVLKGKENEPENAQIAVYPVLSTEEAAKLAERAAAEKAAKEAEGPK